MDELPFTDSHVHFYDLENPALHYSWLFPEAKLDFHESHDAIKAKRYWADDFVQETRLANVGAVIHVQCALGIDDPVEETRWVQAFADRTGVPHGIVAYADLGAPDCEKQLMRHAQSPALRGIRDFRYDDYLTDEGWERGYAQLERHGLVCCDDPLLEHMPAAAELAARHPCITYCVDHAGLPRRRDSEYFKAWREGMRKIARADNTVVKISGLAMCDHTWTVDSIRPWVLECIEAWGVERSFFGSNWPVDRLYSSYTDVIDAYRAIIDDFTAEERTALFTENAKRIFRL